jgi:hypothetical protein
MNNPLAFQQIRCTYIVHIQLRYPDQHSESLPGQEDDTAFLLEELVAQKLSVLFDGVLMDEVKITAVMQAKPTMHLLFLNARCPHHAFPANPHEVEMIEYTLEQQLGCALLELFDAVEIECIEVRFMPSEYE